MNAMSNYVATDGNYGLAGLITDLQKRKWAVAAVVAFFCLSGVIAGLLLPKEYTAKVVFQPVLGESSSGGMGGNVGSLGGGLGGLAALAGVSLPGKSADKEAVAVLQSALLTRMFIQRFRLMPTLFPNKWNNVKQSWRASAAKSLPTLWLANQLFKKKIRKVVENQASGLYVLSIRWRNADTATYWANQIVALTNDYLRGVAVHRSERNIEYLKSQVSLTHDVEVKSAIYALLENQIYREMIAKGRREYALKVIDPAFVPHEPSSLGAVKMGIIGFVFGTLICILIVFALGILRS